MALPANPFTVLSYVSGPALLTNATSLLLLSSTNRFGRAIDRSRVLAAYLEGPDGPRSKSGAANELTFTLRRVQLIGKALVRFYLATGMFAMATMLSVAGAGLGSYLEGVAFEAIIVFAVVSGSIGFTSLVMASVALMSESRLAVRSLRDEGEEAMAAIHRALHPMLDDRGGD